MLTSIRSLMAATVLAGSALVATPALAQGESEFTVSGNVALTSDYRFRGVSFSDGDMAIQGGIDIEHASGFYVGTWGSSIEDSPTYGEMELNLYGGWSGDITSGLTLDVGLLYYAYPAKDTGGGASDYFEPYVSLSTQLGPVAATIGAAYAWKQKSLGKQDNFYVYTDLEAGIPDTPITLTGHLGYTTGALSPHLNKKSGLDWSLGASITAMGGLTFSVAYVGTSGPSVKNFNDDAVVATLSYSF